MLPMTNYWSSSKVTKERDQWLDATVLEVMKDSTNRVLNGWEYNKHQSAFIMKHPKPFSPLVEKMQLHMMLDALGKFGDMHGPHNGIKLSQSINRLVEAGYLFKEKKGKKVRVGLVSDTDFKPYMAF